MTVVAPISDADLPDATQFMRENLNPRIPQEVWLSAFRRKWLQEKPNNGFMLRDQGRIVGTLGAIYSEQQIAGVRRLFCNITSIVVLPEYRGRTLDLFARCLGQKAFNFTDLTPSPAVEKICKLLKFRALASGEYVCPHLPVLPAMAGLRVLPNETAESALPAHVARIHRDHGDLPWLQRLVIGKRDRFCLVIYRRSQVRNLKSAGVLYFSDADLYRDYYWAIGGHLLLRDGLIASRVSRRLFGTPPPLSLSRDSQTLLYRGADIADGDVPSIYSELAALPL